MNDETKALTFLKELSALPSAEPGDHWEEQDGVAYLRRADGRVVMFMNADKWRALRDRLDAEEEGLP